MPDRKWCAAVMGPEDGARLARLLWDAHDGLYPCQQGMRCPLAPRGAGADAAAEAVLKIA